MTVKPKIEELDTAPSPALAGLDFNLQPGFKPSGTFQMQDLAPTVYGLEGLNPAADVVQVIDEAAARARVEDQVPRQLGFIGFAPVLRISALTGRGTHRIFELVDTVFASYSRRIPTPKLNAFLTELRQTGHTVSKGGKQLRLNYATQTRERPPGFTFFANHPKLADYNFERYLENRLRERFDLTGTPVLLKFRQKG